MVERRRSPLIHFSTKSLLDSYPDSLKYEEPSSSSIDQSPTFLRLQVGILRFSNDETLGTELGETLFLAAVGIFRINGGIVFGGGLIGFLFVRNPASLTIGGLLGGAIMAMGILSLKVWRQGLSSLLFMLGQAALVATLLWKHLQVYSLMKIFPSGFYVAVRILN